MPRPDPVIWDPAGDPEAQAERLLAIAEDATRHPMQRAAAITTAGRHAVAIIRALLAELAAERAVKKQAMRERDQAIAERDAALAQNAQRDADRPN